MMEDSKINHGLDIIIFMEIVDVVRDSLFSSLPVEDCRLEVEDRSQQWNEQGRRREVAGGCGRRLNGGEGRQSVKEGFHFVQPNQATVSCGWHRGEEKIENTRGLGL